MGSLHIIAGERLLVLASKVDTGFPCSIGVGRAEHDCSLHTMALCFHIQLAGVTTFSESRSGNHTRDTVSGRGTAPSNVCLVESLDRSPHLPYCKIGRLAASLFMRQVSRIPSLDVPLALFLVLGS